MTPQQIQLVQQSFQKVAPVAELAAAMFYARLFDLDPKRRLLFKSDIKRQGMTLMTMLSSAVRALDDPEALVPVLKSLGRRHAVYGVTDGDYETVAEALLWTLESALGADFDAPTREAWTAVYSLIASAMQMGAREMAEAKQAAAASKLAA